jgi:hypothetical protein
MNRQQTIEEMISIKKLVIEELLLQFPWNTRKQIKKILKGPGTDAEKVVKLAGAKRDKFIYDGCTEVRKE